MQNTVILGDAIENCYLPHNFLNDWPSKLNIATEVVLPWVYSANKKKTFRSWLFKDVYSPF